MKRYIGYAVILVIGIIYGFSIHKYNIFPYEYIKKTYHSFTRNEKTDLPKEEKNYGPYSIGIFSGSTPFDLADTAIIKNPILTGKDINDIDARFVADPFIIEEDSSYYMFFEVMNRKTSQGDIGYAESRDALHWKYKGIILDEKFHLSYPYVFKWKEDYYLIPESHNDLSVRLYKASPFPQKWNYIGNLLSGYHFVDPSIVRYKDKWWMFVSDTHNDALNLYYSNELTKGWIAHPMNPVVKLNKHISRPGGRVIIYNDHVYRFAQDDEPTYGIQVFSFEITLLTEIAYEEKIISEKPVIRFSGKGWNAKGMHQIDAIKVGKRWIAVVDGKN